MRRRDQIICGLIAVEMGALACFALWRRHQAQTTSLPEPKPLSIAVAVVVGASPEFLGKPQSPYTLVEFGDYQCPPCARAYSETQNFLDQRSGKVKFVFRHYPLDRIHPYAIAAANAAESARQQGKFWQMHDALYRLQGNINTDRIDAAALTVGVKTGVVPLSDKTAVATVTRDRRDGDKAGVEGTPTFLLCCPDGRILKLAALSQATRFIR